MNVERSDIPAHAGDVDAGMSLWSNYSISHL